MIELHPRLAQDCIAFGEFDLCTLLLLDDANYPWFILLPNRTDISELHQLDKPDQQQFLSESMHFSRCLEQVYQPDKINIATLGNVVPQLHVHHIARFHDDPSWPAPVWGRFEAVAYTEDAIDETRQRLSDWFAMNTTPVFTWYD